MSSPIEVLEQIAASLGEASQVAVPCLGADDTIEWLNQLQALRAQVDALVCHSLADSDVAAMPATDTGHRTMAAVMAAHTNSNPRPLRADLRVGAWLQDLPVIGDAFRAGAITRDHVEAIRRVENPRTRHYLPDAQDYLVEAAIGCDWPRFLAVLRYWELAFDPDGEEPKEQVDARSCSYTKQGDGTVRGRFNLDPIAGHAFITALEQQTQRLFREDTETGSTRTAGQRRADALVELVSKGATRPNGSVPAPLIHITMSDIVAAKHLEHLADEDPCHPHGNGGCSGADASPPAAASNPDNTTSQPRNPLTTTPDDTNGPDPNDDPGGPDVGANAKADSSNRDDPGTDNSDGDADDPGTGPPDPDVAGDQQCPTPGGHDHNGPDQRCELNDGTPIHPQYGLAALTTAILRRLVLGADSENLDLGKPVRTFPQHLKQVLLILARGRCQQPGCDAPLAWLQADHLMPWSRGGPTAINNGQILCDPHNKIKRDRPPPLQRE